MQRSRTQKQWERILGKQLESKGTVQVASSASLKRIGKISSFALRSSRSALPMLVPPNSILLWKDPVDPRNKESATSLSLLFDYVFNGNSFLVALRRPLSEPFLETAKKIDFKIQKMTSLQKKKAVSAAEPPIEAPAAAVSIRAPKSASRVESMTLGDVMEYEERLIVGGVPYNVIRDPVDIASLTCPLKPLAGCPVFPSVDFRQGSTVVKPIFHWYVYTKSNGKLKDPVSREILTMIEGSSRRFSVTNCDYRWTGDSYVPSAVDEGKLLFVVADLGPEAIVKCGVSKFPIEVVDEPLIFEENVKWCLEEKPSECVRVVSYNILADLYLDLSGEQGSLFFPYCPKSYQMYEYRYPLLLKELSSYDMDICFLQEVDQRMQMRYLHPLFDTLGLEMCFARKQKEVTEGSVIAFRRERFQLLSSACYGLAALLESDFCEDVADVLRTSSASMEVFTSRPTTVQVAVLRDRRSQDIMVCGNTHLHHNPRHEHLKAIQAIVAARQLDSVRRRFTELYPGVQVRLLFAGDFNSTPDGSVYDLLSRGILPRMSDCWALDEQLVARNIQVLPSAIGLVNLTGTGLTNYTRYKNCDGEERGFAGCLDYIWTDSPEILHRVAPRPSHDLLVKYEALPSKIAPSDHIPLICDLNLMKG